jgi:cysteine synthase A
LWGKIFISFNSIFVRRTKLKIVNSILDVIGNTPLLKLSKKINDTEANILVKLEYLNPSGSIKDRIAIRMITEAEKAGKIKPGDTVTDASTGNTGIALAFVSAVKGYKCLICVPEGVAVREKSERLKVFGAEIIEVPMEEEVKRELRGTSVHGAIAEITPRKKCLELERTQSNTWWARQALSPDNTLAHKYTTGKEILDQTDGKVDAYVAAVGTGGTLLGVAEALLEKNPNVKIFAIEPSSSPLLKVAEDTGSLEESSSLFTEAKKAAEGKGIAPYMRKYKIPGLEGWIIIELIKKGILEDTIVVSDQDAIDMANRLAREEGLFVGISSGGNVYAALEVARRLGKGKTVVTVLPDTRDRYWSYTHFIT